MSTDSGAGNDSTVLKRRTEYIYLDELDRQTDVDGRFFYTNQFVTTTANNNRFWRWMLLRTGYSQFNLCVEPLSAHSITLRSVALYGKGCFPSLLAKKIIGQPVGQSYQSGDFSAANRMPRLDEAFTRSHRNGIVLTIDLEWTEAKVNAPISMSPAQPCVLEHLYNNVMDGGDTVFELVSSDDQSFSINVTILEAKSEYFKRFFATEGWKEQTEGRMMLTWPSAVVKQTIRYMYLNNVDGDVCQFLPDILDAAQMWELIGLKSLIEAQMKERLQKAAQDADTDTAAEYLKMEHLHNLTSLVPICNRVLADNYDKFYESDICRQMDQNETYRHLIKNIFHHKRK